MRPDNRAVSTVVDVALALLLVTASVATMVVFLGNEDPEPETRTPDEVVQTLSATTITADYSLGGLEPEPTFEDEGYYNYDRTAHGTAIELLAEATVTSTEFDTTLDDDRLYNHSDGYVDGVEAGLNERVTGTRENVHVVAIWRPHNRSDVEGRISVGPDVPADASVSTTTIRVDSRFEAISDERIRRTYERRGMRAVARLMAERIVEGHFPPTATQLAIEKRGLSGAVVRYRYQRLGRLIRHSEGGSDFEYTSNTFGQYVYERDNADARRANADAVDDLTEVILAELNEKFDEDGDGDAEVSAATLADAISLGDVVVVVQTW